MDGFANHKENYKQPPNEHTEPHSFSKQDNRIPHILLDYYSKSNNLPSKNNYSKTKDAIQKIDTLNSANNNNTEKSVFSSIEHFPPTFPTRNKKPSHNATSFREHSSKLMEEDREEEKETSKGEHEERGRGSRGRESGKCRYKTELCRPFEENGSCKYAEKCQFAHGRHELRTLVRHPKYKTDLCKTYHTTGLCPYGLRCHFIHNNLERNMSQANKLILELAEKTILIKQQSSLFNQKLIASLLNGQQPNISAFNQISNSPTLQPPYSSQQLDLFRQVLASNSSSCQQQPSKHRQNTLLFSRSMNSSSPSGSSSLNESPTTSPTNLPTHLPTNPSMHLLRKPPSNLPTSYPPHMLCGDEDMLSAKLKCIMHSAGF